MSYERRDSKIVGDLIPRHKIELLLVRLQEELARMAQTVPPPFQPYVRLLGPSLLGSMTYSPDLHASIEEYVRWLTTDD